MARDRRPTLELAEERELRRWARQARSNPRRARRARIILELARGGSVNEVAARVGVHPETVVRWRRRFRVHRLEGLARDAPRVHTRRAAEPTLAYRVLRTTWDEPPSGTTRWSTRSLARELRVNHMLVHRVWKSHGIRIPSPAGDVGPPAEPSPPEVLGVYLEGPAALAIRFPTEGDRIGPLAVAASGVRRTAPDTSRSAAYRVETSTRSSLALLAALDRAYLDRAVGTRGPGWSSPELLVFLRSAAERSRVPGDVHVFFDRAIPLGEPRLDAWIATHPGVRFHDPDPTESWTVSIDRWLRSGPLRSALEDRLLVGAQPEAALR